MESKIGAILNNPQMMQTIASLAQSLGQSDTAQPQEAPQVDLQLLQKLSGLAAGSAIDKDQRTLLSALRPYLTPERIGKLEKAMRAAKLASLASGILSQSGR